MSSFHTLIIYLEINRFDQFLIFKNNQFLKRRWWIFHLSYNFYQTKILTVPLLIWPATLAINVFKVLLNDLFQDNLGFVEAAKTCDSAGYHLAYEIDQEAARSGDNIKCRLLSTGHLFFSPLKETIIVPYTLYIGRIPTKDDILKYMRMYGINTL